MGLLLFLSISAVAIASAALLVTRGLTVGRVKWISSIALATAASLALLGAPYLAALEALIGAALVPGLLLASLAASARDASSDAARETVSLRRRALGAAISGSVFLLLVIVIRSSATLQGPGFERETIASRDIAAVGSSLLGTEVIGFEAVAALTAVALIAAARLAGPRRGAAPEDRSRTERESP